MKPQFDELAESLKRMAETLPVRKSSVVIDLTAPLTPSPRLARSNLIRQGILDAMTDDEDGNR